MTRSWQAILILAVLISGLALAPAAFAQSDGARCDGMTVAEAEAAGFLVQNYRDATGPVEIRGVHNQRDFIVGSEFGDDLRGVGAGDIVCTLGGKDRIITDQSPGGEARFFLGDGLDRVRAQGALFPVYVVAGEGDDVIYGSMLSDRIQGGPGDDTLYARRGDDTIWGGPGNDIIEGQHGNNRLRGDDGDDTIVGGDGNDHIIGGDGDDIIDSAYGRNVVQGGDGNDEILGRLGGDRLYGGAGNDLITENGRSARPSVLQGGPGDDHLVSKTGDDSLYGGPDDDHLEGGDGYDTLIGDDGTDVLDGGRANDRCLDDGVDALVNCEPRSADFARPLVYVAETAQPARVVETMDLLLNGWTSDDMGVANVRVELRMADGSRRTSEGILENAGSVGTRWSISIPVEPGLISQILVYAIDTSGTRSLDLIFREVLIVDPDRPAPSVSVEGLLPGPDGAPTWYLQLDQGARLPSVMVGLIPEAETAEVGLRIDGGSDWLQSDGSVGSTEYLVDPRTREWYSRAAVPAGIHIIEVRTFGPAGDLISTTEFTVRFVDDRCLLAQEQGILRGSITNCVLDGIVAPTPTFQRLLVFTDSSLVGADLRGFADDNGDFATFIRTNLTGALFGGEIYGVRFENLSVVEADFSGTSLSQASFIGVDARDANFSNIRGGGDGPYFVDSDLTGADFTGATLYEPTFRNSICPDGSSSDDNPTCGLGQNG